jgi:hypothetical protein
MGITPQAVVLVCTGCDRFGDHGATTAGPLVPMEPCFARAALLRGDRRAGPPAEPLTASRDVAISSRLAERPWRVLEAVGLRLRNAAHDSLALVKEEGLELLSHCVRDFASEDYLIPGDARGGP